MIPLLAALPLPNPPPLPAGLVVPSDAASLFAAELPPEEETIEEDAAAGEPPGLPPPLACQMPELPAGVPLELPEAAGEVDCATLPATAFAFAPGQFPVAPSDQPASDAALAMDALAAEKGADQKPDQAAAVPVVASDHTRAGGVPPSGQEADGAGFAVHVVAERAAAPVRASGAQSAFELRAESVDDPKQPEAVETGDENNSTELEAERMPDVEGSLDSSTGDSQPAGVLPLPGMERSARPVIGQVQAAVVALTQMPSGEGAPDAASATPAPERGVELRLDPEELGQVSISLRSEGDALMVRVMAERPETLDLLRRNADQLLQDLRNSGFRDAQMAFGSSGEGARGGQHPAADPGLRLAEEEVPAQPPPVSAFAGSRPFSRDGALNVRL